MDAFFFVNQKKKHFRKIDKPTLNIITQSLENENYQKVDFKAETLTFTLRILDFFISCSLSSVFSKIRKIFLWFWWSSFFQCN